MTHLLLWSHATNAMRVATPAWLHARNRESYTGNTPPVWAPIAQGGMEDMRAAMENCRGMLVSRSGPDDGIDALVIIGEPREVAA